MTEHPVREPNVTSVPAHCSVWPLLASTAILYAAFGLIYGLMQGGLPPLLRARGVDLASIGWSFIVLVPFGLTFLWAPLIDAVRPLPSAPRIGWTVPMQAIIVVLLLIVARGETFPPALLLGLGIAFAAATMDVALDALSTSCVPPRHRTAAGGLKVAALALGSIFGGGVFVACAERLGWVATFDICAAVSVFAAIPILLNRSWDRNATGAERGRPDIVAILRRPGTRHRMALLTLTTCAMVALSFFKRVMLVDLGVPIERIGGIVGTDYAVLYGASRLVATLLQIALAQVVVHIGWPAFYIGAGLALVLAPLLMRRTLPDLRTAKDAIPSHPSGTAPHDIQGG